VFGVAAASRNTRFQADRYDLTWTGLAPADRTSFPGAFVAVGMRVTSHPPHSSVRAAFPHTVPTLGIHGNYMLPYASQQL
jgi:hypothetical protein